MKEMTMLMILEGPDGAGKSTLVRSLRNVLGDIAYVMDAGPPTRHPLDEYELPLLKLPDDRHIICDRWHLGEAVYPAVLRRATDWDVAVERHLYMFMRSRGAFVILMLSTHDELVARVELRGDDLITAGQLQQITDGYERLNAQHFNMIARGRGELWQHIISMARAVSDVSAPLQQFETYVGPPRPSVLLLGERRAVGTNEPRSGLPAFMPYRNTSGHFLLSHLDVINHNVGIANACDVDDAHALWKTLGEPPTVALGVRASGRLDDANVPHGIALHPQFVRRFLHQHGDTYASGILDAARTGRNLLSWRP